MADDRERLAADRRRGQGRLRRGRLAELRRAGAYGLHAAIAATAGSPQSGSSTTSSRRVAGRLAERVGSASASPSSVTVASASSSPAGASPSGLRGGGDHPRRRRAAARPGRRPARPGRSRRGSARSRRRLTPARHSSASQAARPAIPSATASAASTPSGTGKAAAGSISARSAKDPYGSTVLRKYTSLPSGVRPTPSHPDDVGQRRAAAVEAARGVGAGRPGSSPPASTSTTAWPSPASGSSKSPTSGDGPVLAEDRGAHGAAAYNPASHGRAPPSRLRRARPRARA